MDYQEFLEQVEKGEILIGVEPAIARKFFTDTDRSIVKVKMGESLLMQRFLVTACSLLEYICLLAGVIASIPALKWYSVVAIPLMLVASFILGGRASMGRQKIKGAISLWILCVLLSYFLRDKGVFMILWLLLLPLPYLFARLTYKLATMFLRFLSFRNEKAFNQLYNKAIFVKKKEE